MKASALWSGGFVMILAAGLAMVILMATLMT